jgi:hypothetical protein
MQAHTGNKAKAAGNSDSLDLLPPRPLPTLPSLARTEASGIAFVLAVSLPVRKAFYESSTERTKIYGPFPAGLPNTG